MRGRLGPRPDLTYGGLGEVRGIGGGGVRAAGGFDLGALNASRPHAWAAGGWARGSVREHGAPPSGPSAPREGVDASQRGRNELLQGRLGWIPLKLPA